jgi:hypothetical protein
MIYPREANSVATIEGVEWPQILSGSFREEKSSEIGTPKLWVLILGKYWKPYTVVQN